MAFLFFSFLFIYFFFFLEQAKTWFAIFCLLQVIRDLAVGTFIFVDVTKEVLVLLLTTIPVWCFPFSTIRVDGTGYCSCLRSRNPICFSFLLRGLWLIPSVSLSFFTLRISDSYCFLFYWWPAWRPFGTVSMALLNAS